MQESNAASTFPPPPEAYKLFTEENIEAYKRDPESVSADVAQAMGPRSVPTGPYRVFGQVWPLEDSLPSLKDSGVTQLYPDSFDLVAELQKLAKSLLVNFLELLVVMGKAPEKFGSKLGHMRLLMLNIHHLINQFRPHQGRETLIEMMTQQIDERSKRLEDLRGSNELARQTLAKLALLDTIDTCERMEVETEEKSMNGKTTDTDHLDLKLYEVLKASINDGKG